MKTIGAFFLALCLAVPAAWAGPEGTYAVTGANPDGASSYKGTVTVIQTDESYFVSWKIGNDVYEGSAVGGRVVGGDGFSGPASPQDSMLVVSFGSGVSFMFKQPGTEDYSGYWVNDGGQKLGTETWIRN